MTHSAIGLVGTNQANEGDGGDDDGRIGGGRRGDGNDGRRPLITCTR